MLFALAWYDAFGVRGSAHRGRLVKEPAPQTDAFVGVLSAAQGIVLICR